MESGLNHAVNDDRVCFALSGVGAMKGQLSGGDETTQRVVQKLDVIDFGVATNEFVAHHPASITPHEQQHQHCKQR